MPVSLDEEFRILPDRIASDRAVDMECHNLYGRMIKRNKDSFLTITGLEKGIYIISATLDDGTRRSFKYRKTTP